MKTVLAVAVTALVCASSSFAVGTSVGRGEFNALKNRVARAERAAATANARAANAQTGVQQALGETAAIRSCNRQYVAVQRRNLYLMSDGSNLFAAAHVFLTTALDVVAAGTAGSVNVGIVDPSCASSLRAYRWTAK
jgi:hypothetical protein